MPKAISKTGSELFIVDNSEEDWKVVRYLHDWCQISKAIDIATGYFEIGSLLALKGEWQKVDSIRILMGDEVSRRTQKAFQQALGQVRERLDGSLEQEKLKNDFLEGVPAIVEAIKSGKIQCRVYKKDKFHAKAYITHARMEVIGSFALVGSSNFTAPGLQDNLELNVQITGGPVSVLQEWYEKHWNEAEDVTPEVLEVIDRHVREYAPFDVYAKALQEFFRGHEMTATEWEQNESKIYPILATYQKQGYHGLLKHAQVYNGAFLCDGVGLGKTFIGLMLIERLILLDRKNVVLFVPKSGRKAVWESKLRQYLPHLFGKYSRLEIFNHTDLMRKGDWQEDLRTVAERADVVIIDEAHNFRNTGTKGSNPEERLSRYWRLFDLIQDKTVFMLTATPVNNQLTDLLHMIELFSRQRQDYFSRLGIHNLQSHFRQMERQIDKAIRDAGSEEETPTEINTLEAGRVLGSDALFQELVVQRSRSYVRRSVAKEDGSDVLFPMPKEPKVQPYSVKQTYGKLLEMLEGAFAKKDPLFSLAIYFPLAYYKGKDADKIAAFDRGRQEQVVRLIRTGFLKRFESSVEAFRMSCWRLLKKLLAWAEVHAADPRAHSRIERWKRQNEALLGSAASAEQRLNGLEEDEDSDLLSQADIQSVEKLDPEEFDIDAILDETLLDLDQIAKFLDLLKSFKPSQDKKLTALKQLLKKDSVLSKHKVIIFTEFMDTAKYLYRELKGEVSGLEEIDGQNSDRYEIITRFAPYYNGTSSPELAEQGLEEIRVLISTDVLSEGLNLQDATRLINYDLHWNPVRLMQRIGRIDRRMDPNVEARILADHPEEKKLRGEVGYWNFLPPDELDDLLRLYKTVSKKTLRISKTFGIEGKKLLTPEDDFEELKNFHEAYEGTLSPLEAMHLEYQELLKQSPDLEKRLNTLPGKVFSGKEHPLPSTKAVFFCYALPAKAASPGATEDEEENWSIEAGRVQWFLYDLEKGKDKILEEPTEILSAIRCLPSTPRKTILPRPKLSEIRAEIEKYIKNGYLKRVQAPIGVKPVLRAWMELN
jgi:hypothetical protein